MLDYIQRGWLNGPARFTYERLVGVEYAVERVRDRLRFDPTRNSRGSLTDLTAIIKTFERPGSLDRLLGSIRRICPELRLIVVDDSRQPREIAGVEMVILPFDSGVSAGRAEGLKRVATEYVMMLDDDFVFYRRSRLAEALTLLNTDP